MKRRKAMKGILLSLASLAIITSGTMSVSFARFMATETASDQASVAKWGLDVSMTGDLFSDTYTLQDGTFVAEGNLSSEIEPGSTGSGTLELTGTSEVKAQLVLEADVELGDNWVSDGKFYCPLTFTIGDQTYDGTDYASADAFETALENAIEACGQTYEANAVLDAAPAISIQWNWGDGEETSDDSALGIKAADGETPTCRFVLNATLKQVD